MELNRSVEHTTKSKKSIDRNVTLYGYVGGKLEPLVHCVTTGLEPATLTAANDSPEAQIFLKSLTEEGVRERSTGEIVFPKEGIFFIRALIDHYSGTSRYDVVDNTEVEAD